jgi:hypothetical protein
MRRQTREIYYFKQTYEVDFFALNTLINVCMTLDKPETRRREIRALEEAMGRLKIPRAYMLTADHEETIPAETGDIYAVPVWKWLCRLPEYLPRKNNVPG